MMETRILIDWISNTNHSQYNDNKRFVHPVLQDIIGWERVSKSLNGYDNVEKHFSGALRMSSSTQRNMGLHIIHSGKVLELMRDRLGISAIEVLKYYYKIGANTSRIDLAIDVFNSQMSIDSLGSDLDKNICSTMAKSGLMVKNVPEGTGQTLYIGSIKKRKKLMRIYDKGKETGQHPNWIRIEYEIHGKPAREATEILCTTHNFGVATKSIIRGYCDFYKNSIWIDIMENVHKTKLSGESTQETDTQKWLLDVCAGALSKQVKLDPEFANKWNKRVEFEAKKQGIV